jgi:hypothetical protein
VTTEQVVAVLELWEEKVTNLLALAEDAEENGNATLASAYTQRAFALSEARIDLKCACPELQLPPIAELFRKPQLRAVPTKEAS